MKLKPLGARALVKRVSGGAEGAAKRKAGTPTRGDESRRRRLLEGG